jgi:hypothetical protein
MAMAAMPGMRRLDGTATPQSVAAQAARSKAAEWKGVAHGEARREGAAASSTRWDPDHDRPMPPPMARAGAHGRPVGIAQATPVQRVEATALPLQPRTAVAQAAAPAGPVVASPAVPTPALQPGRGRVDDLGDDNGDAAAAAGEPVQVEEERATLPCGSCAAACGCGQQAARGGGWFTNIPSGGPQGRAPPGEYGGHAASESGSEDESEDEDEVQGLDTNIFSMEFSESDDEDGEWFEDGEGCDLTHGWSSHSHAPPHRFKPICIWTLVIHGAMVAT